MTPGITWLQIKQDVLARLVVCGSWIEGIYITTNIANTSRDNTEFLEILANQKNSLNRLVNLMEPVKDREDVNGIFKGLFDIQDIYEDVGDKMTEEQLARYPNESKRFGQILYRTQSALRADLS